MRVGDLGAPLLLGEADVVVSGLAIHHLDDERKRSLYAEVATALRTGGVFANLDVVASATDARHAAFLAAIDRPADDPEDRLAPVDDQLAWLRAAGLVEVDCLWRWRGFALLVGKHCEQRRRRRGARGRRPRRGRRPALPAAVLRRAERALRRRLRPGDRPALELDEMRAPGRFLLARRG